MRSDCSCFIKYTAVRTLLLKEKPRYLSVTSRRALLTVFAYDTTEHQYYFNCLSSNVAMMPSREPNFGSPSSWISYYNAIMVGK